MSENHRRDCLARYYLNRLKRREISREKIEEWLNKKTHSETFKDDMRRRLNEQMKLLKKG